MSLRFPVLGKKIFLIQNAEGQPVSVSVDLSKVAEKATLNPGERDVGYGGFGDSREEDLHRQVMREISGTQ